MKIDEDLAVIHGYLCADGYVIKNPKIQKHKYYYIGFRNYDKSLLKDFQKRFYKLFSIKPYLCKDGRCRIQNKELYYYFTKNFGSFYSKEWALPKLSKTNLKNWLRAFFDCESWVYCKKHKNRHIGLDSINYQGLLQVQKALLLFGINSKIKKRRNRNIYRLSIFGKDNILKFNRDIGFLNLYKKGKLKRVINSYVDYKWNVNKLNFEKIFREKAKIRKDNNVIRLCSILKINLKEIKNFLNKLKIGSSIYKRKNGLGREYYELTIYKKENINKLVSLSLIKEVI